MTGFSPCSRSAFFLFFLLVWSAHGHRLRSEPNKKAGAKVGEVLKSADEQTEADVGQNGGSSSLRKALVSEVTSEEQALVNPAVTAVFAKSNSIAAGTVVDADAMCARDWAKPCPDGWDARGDLCVAPVSYQGQCDRVMPMKQHLVDKSKFVEECRAPWPCQDAACPAGRNYDSPCPTGWTNSGNGFCTSSSGDDCPKTVKFDDMDIISKQEMAFACQFEWPCEATCAPDYNKLCPKGWTEVPMNPSLCMAPTDYAGDCGYSVSTKGMTPEQKWAWAAKCGAQFPCSGEGEVGSGISPNQRPEVVIENGPIDFATGHANFFKP